MKLRIRDNSIRLRLTRGEVDQLRDKGVVQAITPFPDGCELRYEVESSPASASPAAFLSNNKVTVRLPESAVGAWAESEQVSLTGEQQHKNGQQLSILVEKDFACLAPREGEDESDMYPHPAAEGGEGQC